MNRIDQTSAQSWQKVVEGDTGEFAALVDQNKNLITSIAYASIGDLSSSEDIAQETFLLAWQSRQELRDPSKLISWLSAIARNLAKQWVRKRSAKSWASTDLDSSKVPYDQPHPSERLVSDEEQQLVWGALEAIPESYREVLVMYYRESHSIADVALALEISEETARQRLSRGRNLLRAEVERTIESALVRSRPSVHFTASVMSLIAAGTGSAVGKAATTATAGLLGKTAAQGALVAATQTASTGAMVGAAGGMLGALGGLGGTWLGIRVPQLLAPTMTERRLLEREGRVIWRFALIFIFLTMAMVAAALISGPRPNLISVVVVGNVVLGFIFAITCIVRGIRASQEIKHIRRTIRPEDDPNPTWLKDRMGVQDGVTNGIGKSAWVGRRTTSARRFLGWPIYDFQVSDPASQQTVTEPLHAKGWIAVGDRATGFLAIGGFAKGFCACGGVSIGAISFGGAAIGLCSFGGLALGLLAMGGLAVGHSAIGGGAIGWQAVGGCALAMHSANGGMAVGGHMAEGGHAISWHYAVGGLANAPEANSELAKSECAKSWMAPYIGTQVVLNNPKEFRRNVMIYCTIVPIGFSLVFSLGVPILMYRRSPAASTTDSTQDAV